VDGGTAGESGAAPDGAVERVKGFRVWIRRAGVLTLASAEVIESLDVAVDLSWRVAATVILPADVVPERADAPSRQTMRQQGVVVR